MLKLVGTNVKLITNVSSSHGLHEYLDLHPLITNVKDSSHGLHEYLDLHPLITNVKVSRHGLHEYLDLHPLITNVKEVVYTSI